MARAPRGGRGGRGGRRGSGSRGGRGTRRPALLALAAAALAALVALAALALGGAFHEPPPSTASEAHVATSLAVGSSDHSVEAVHAVHHQPSTRARSAVVAVLASAAFVVAWTSGRIRGEQSGRPRTVRVAGLPPGRAPPALRIA